MAETKFTKIENWDDAYKRLVEGVGQRDASFILSLFRDEWKDHLPHIKVSQYEKGLPKTYQSELEGFPSWGFDSELEANLANAIFLLSKSTETAPSGDRLQVVFQLVLELLDVQSEWRLR